jgi:hypothetical protein
MTSIFIAKLMGPIILAFGLAILIDKKAMLAMAKELLGSRALIFMFGILDLLLGLILVVVHNIWVLDWRVLITLIGWISIVRGLVRMWFVPAVMKTGPRLLKNEGLLTGITAVMLIVGVVLSYYGYAALLRI